MKGEGKFTNFI